MQEGCVITEQGERRIFEGELVEVRSGRWRMRGFHLEDKALMAARGIVADEPTRTAADSRGVYKVTVSIQGAKRKEAYGGMFPIDWSREDVRAAIGEAWAARSPRAQGWVDPGGFFKGRTQSGMLIMMELDGVGRVLDAFPIRAGSGRSNRRRDALYRVGRGVIPKHHEVCGRCHELKVWACPNGHNAPVSVRVEVRLPKWLRFLLRVK
jgi:Bacterial EndoU nuclease